jgi:tetratricopeptide (TPR) repeat protein
MCIRLSLVVWTLCCLVLTTASTSSAAKFETGDNSAKSSTLGEKTAQEHNDRAVQLSHRGQWAEAVSEHEKAVAGEPENRVFRNSLSTSLLRYGDACMSKQHYKHACKLYERALQADTENLSAKSGLSEARKLVSSAGSEIE